MNLVSTIIGMLFMLTNGQPLSAGDTPDMPYKVAMGKPVPNEHPDLRFVEIPLEIEIEERVPPGCDQGPCRGTKHVRLTVNPENGLIYWHGGDFGFDGHQGSEYPHFKHSARQEIFTYDIENDQWNLVMPYCVKDNFIFGHPDQHGWVWDSKRRIFWSLPGQQRYFGTSCDGTRGMVMGFDPRTEAWSMHEPQKPAPWRSEFAVYDEKTDRVYMLGLRNDVMIWNPNNHEWSSIEGDRLPRRRNSTYVSLVGRDIYTIDYFNNELAAYNIDDGVMRSMAPLPWKSSECEWGTANELNYIVYVEHLNALFVYDWGCYKKSWLYWMEQAAWQEIDTGKFDGRNLVYHPKTRNLFVMGDSGDMAMKFDNDDTTPYLLRINRK